MKFEIDIDDGKLAVIVTDCVNDAIRSSFGAPTELRKRIGSVVDQHLLALDLSGMVAEVAGPIVTEAIRDTVGQTVKRLVKKEVAAQVADGSLFEGVGKVKP